MATRMIQRRGTAAEWSSANPVLAAGEIGFETDTQKFKFGDGTTAWADITYFASADQLIDGAPELLDTLNELAAAIGDDENFITTITTDLATKLDAAGGTISGNLIVQSDATVGGTLSTSTAPTNPVDVTNKEYVDDLVNPVALDVTTLQSSVSGIESSLTTINTNISSNAIDISDLQDEQNELRRTFIKSSTPTSTDNGGNAIEQGALWYNTANGHLYAFIELDGGTAYVWAEVGGDGSTTDLPTSPADGDTHNDYVYDSANSVWNIDRSTEISDNTDVAVLSVLDEQVLMYNATSGQFENVKGIKLDEDGDIPTTFAGKIQALLTGDGAESTTLKEVEDKIATDIATSESGLVAGATTYTTLGEIETYLGTGLFSDVPALTVKSAADWGTDTGTPLSGSINVETGGAEIKVKVGNGTDTYANLDYVPTNGSVASDIATAIAPLAPKADPTFSGTVSLPSTTSIGDVSDAEIAHLDGVTSGIQGQLDDLDTLKAPLADPTFTGTVSGIDKTMVGLSNVDNTSDVNKPVSTAQQAALDTKLNLAGGTLTGKLTLDGDPTQALHAATKQYVDSAEAGLSTKPQVVAASTGNIAGTYDNGTDGVGATLNLGQLATLDIDGITSWSLLDGILLKDQTTPAENGRWVVDQIGNDTDTDWILRRCSLCDTADEIPGAYIFVVDGATNEQTGWVLHVDNPATFVVGTDDIDAYQFAGAGAVTAGTNVSVAGSQVSVVDAPVFAGTVDASAAGVAFSDGTQTQAGVPSLTTFVEKTASYQLDTLDHKDNVVEMNMSTAGTFTVPLDATLAWPVGASMDIFATGTGEITIAAEAGVTLNATPGLILRTQWSSATIMKRGADNWVVYGDLKA